MPGITGNGAVLRVCLASGVALRRALYRAFLCCGHWLAFLRSLPQTFREYMDTLQIFREHRKALVEQWINAVFNTYPLDTTGFLRTRQDQFCNPVGEITSTVAGHLYDAVAGEHVLADRVREALERFVRLRSVQDFPPSQGLGIIYVFKHIVREALLPVFVKEGKVAEFLEAESRLDTLALMAFDMYLASRETLAEQRIKEIRDQHAQIVRWAQHTGNKDAAK